LFIMAKEQRLRLSYIAVAVLLAASLACDAFVRHEIGNWLFLVFPATVITVVFVYGMAALIQSHRTR
jgi:hypothetical protein